MHERIFGYARVSTKEQNEARQMRALADFGVEKRDIFIDRQSGKDFLRPAYIKLMRKLRQGDIVVVQSIDRLGRNYDDILEQWRLITKEKRADIVIIDMPLLDTRNKSNGLTGTFIADMVLQILSYVAQTERENIKQRQKEGIEAAKLRGVRFGRPEIILPPLYESLKEQWQNGEISAIKAADKLGVSYKTFLRRARA